MTIPATEPLLSGPYNGNGVTTVFSYSFRVFSEDELLVYRKDLTGIETLYTLGVDYSVSPTGGSFPATGGTIVMAVAPATGNSLVILPDITRSQDRPFSSQSSITLQEIEDALDKLTAMARQLYERSLRAVTVSAFNPGDIETLLANIDAIVALEDEIVVLSANIAAVQNVSTNIAAVQNVDTNMASVIAAPAAAAAAAASATSADFLNHGLGVTGNAPLIANIDATGTASGTRRYDNTTTGTFPGGVTAAATGLVTIDRQTSAEGMMILRPAGTARTFVRFLSASTWGPWTEVSPELFYRPNAALVGANVATPQDIFALDVTLEDNTVYEFEMFANFVKTAGATSHDMSIGYGGSASTSAFHRHVLGSGVAGAGTLNASLSACGYVASPSQTVLSGAIANANINRWVREQGTFVTLSGGTIIPQYQLSAAPGGAYSVLAGSFFKLRRLGAAGADRFSGPWA